MKAQAKGIVVILAVTIAVGGIAARVLYNRVLHGNDAQNACINNLMEIEGAKKIVVQEHGFKRRKIVNQGDLEPYLIGEWRSCPAGGKYTSCRHLSSFIIALQTIRLLFAFLSMACMSTGAVFTP